MKRAGAVRHNQRRRSGQVMLATNVDYGNKGRGFQKPLSSTAAGNDPLSDFWYDATSIARTRTERPEPDR